MNICKECEMPIIDGEFHPYAACLMFRGCGDAGIVRKNLIPFHQQRLRAEAAEAKLRALEMQEPVAYFQKWNGMHEQISDEYKTDPDVYPLYAKPFPAPKQEEKIPPQFGLTEATYGSLRKE